LYDTSSTFDSTTNYRWTPATAGYYILGLNVRWGFTPGSAGQTHGARFYLNGSTEIARTINYPSNGVACTGLTVETLRYFNGTTDYVEVQVYQDSGASQNLQGGSADCYFYGAAVQGATGATGATGTNNLGLVDTIGIWGDGSDGNLDMDGSTSYTGIATRSGSVYSAQKGTILANNLTVRNGQTFRPGGARVLVLGTLTIESGGVIESNATSSTTPGNLGSAYIFGAGTNGGAGGNNSNGTAGTSNTNAVGGSGGNGGGTPLPRTGGSGGTATAPAANVGGAGAVFSLSAATHGNVMGIAGVTNLKGGAGGGGGSSDDAGFVGGAGGAGGGIVSIFARLITGSGAIEAKGYQGGTPVDSPGRELGGGGGGGGGVIFIVTTSTNYKSGGITVSVAGGTGGAGKQGGSNGADGSAGKLIEIFV
jgi:hypothetical protein